ncbi:sigma factor [Pseudomonas schmalbachii]|uniref:RNA polymerase sigma-70 region 2 domain-containing protein n=1 Tax=Pseudomonas schmalbachii TaxID=2816993 RepID=A0ABS3TX36_9PSED|nr:sigma factor [Pseudomonas schmalbachii]MBO3278241.1 hypothetical protein [Pseudomonas schmalbachii]
MPLPSASPLAALYRSHHGWLFGWLRKRLGCPENAADAAQDTFAKLIGRNELESLQEPRTYLLVAANRLLINQYHRRRVEEETAMPPYACWKRACRFASNATVTICCG